MDNAVEQPAEQPAPVESAPIETKEADTQPQEVESQASASTEPEKEVSRSVPYERFKEVNDRLKNLEEQISRGGTQAPEQGYQAPEDVPQLDPESAKAVDYYIESKLAQRQTQNFLAKHGAELQDPVLAGTVGQLINRDAGKGIPVDHEALLQEAKKLLDERVKPAVKQATTQGIEQGKELEHKKGELGAVGVSAKTPEVDPNTLSLEEFRKYHGLTFSE